MITYKGKGPIFAIAEREKFLREISEQLPEHHVFLSTCGRVELYSSSSDSIDISELRKTSEHLFRVASGLDSPLLGESQILSQLKLAYSAAQDNGTADKELHFLFQNAFRVGKRVRCESGIGIGALSHAQVAADIIKEYFPDLSCKNIALIGAHNLTKNVLQYLIKRGANAVFLGNRTFEKAEALGKEFGCSAFKLTELEEVIHQTDILVSATSAPHYIVKPEMLLRSKKMLILDLAVPRDVDPKIASLPDITMYNIADIEARVKLTITQRRDKRVPAEKIVQDEVNVFIDSYLKKIIYCPLSLNCAAEGLSL